MFGRQLGIEREAALLLLQLQDFLEAVVLDAEHDVAEHLDEATVAVIGEAGVAALLYQALDRFVVKAEVEHRVHHAGHGDPCARTDGHEQRIGRIAKTVPGGFLDVGQALRDLLVQIVGIGTHLGKAGAGFGGDGEAGRHRQADRCHLCEIGALAAKQVAHVRAALTGTAAKGVDPLAHDRLSVSCRATARERFRASRIHQRKRLPTAPSPQSAWTWPPARPYRSQPPPDPFRLSAT